MPASDLPRRAAIALAGVAAIATSARAATSSPKRVLTEVATFEQQMTGVAVARDGRIFVNFPRWEHDVPISVAELSHDGSLKPYPNAEWNAWSNLKPLSPEDHFVCVQSVTVDPQGFLWVVDPAAPGNEFNIPGGPKLLKIDLSTDRVLQVVHFDQTTVPQGSYLNDVRVSPDGKFAYLTDSGQRGALLVVDVASGQPRRLLDGHSSTQVEPGVVVHTDGRELRRPDHRGPQFAADSIALDPEGNYLYWQALTGHTMYRIATTALTDKSLSPERVASAVERLGPTCIADGYWMDRKGTLFVTSPEDNSVKQRRADGTLDIVVQDRRLRWPDSMAEGADGALFVTASHIQDMAHYHAHRSTRTEPYGLFRFVPGQS